MIKSVLRSRLSRRAGGLTTAFDVFEGEDDFGCHAIRDFNIVHVSASGCGVLFNEGDNLRGIIFGSATEAAVREICFDRVVAGCRGREFIALGALEFVEDLEGSPEPSGASKRSLAFDGSLNFMPGLMITAELNQCARRI